MLNIIIIIVIVIIINISFMEFHIDIYKPLVGPDTQIDDKEFDDSDGEIDDNSD